MGLICKWADDSQRLILEYFDVISNSPSEIYHYALPFSPSESWLHECYSSELLQEVKVIKGFQAGWGMCSRTVHLDSHPTTLTCWKNTVAVGLHLGNITILNGISGTHLSTISGHTGFVASLAFSLDGVLLVSGGEDATVSLWDVQTGGAVKTFCGHTSWVWSVSISQDCAIIASGSEDNTIRLWNTKTGECNQTIVGDSTGVNSVNFSPTNSQLLVSGFNSGTIQQWDVGGQRTGLTYDGHEIAFSSDGAHFVSHGWAETVATVRNFDSGEVVAKFQASSTDVEHYCFSPDGRFVAGASGSTIYVWDITNSDPRPIKTLIGHTKNITSLTFSSSLISSSDDQSIKFWQIGTSLVDLVATNSRPTPLAPAPIISVHLRADVGIAISSNSAGVVRTWDISTGICKASFHTPAQDHFPRDVWLLNGTLIFNWCIDRKMYIWDTKEAERLHIVDIHQVWVSRPSGDGSKVFLLGNNSIQARSTWTGEIVGEVIFEGEPLTNSLVVDGSRVWVHFEGSQSQGWDFGTPGSTPIQLSGIPPSSLDKPHLEFEIGDTSPSRIKDTITGKEVFRLSGRHAEPTVTQWDGQYLVAGYSSGEVLILDLSQMTPQ